MNERMSTLMVAMIGLICGAGGVHTGVENADVIAYFLGAVSILASAVLLGRADAWPAKRKGA